MSQNKRSKRHRRARHKISRKQAVEVMKEWTEYAREVQRKDKARFAKPSVHS